MSQSEGIIKFKCNWNKTELIDAGCLADLIHYRNLLFTKKLIGCDDDGIGYGNISCRHLGNTFFISGSATGDVKHFSKKHISLVTDFNIGLNNLHCSGPVKASSESLSHAVIYHQKPEVNAVIHIHHKIFWEKYLNKLPTTSPLVEYGTPEMAVEISKLLDKDHGIIIMGGHEDGIICYGTDMHQAFELVERLY